MERESGGPRAWLGEFLAGFRDAWGTGIPRERDFLFPDPCKGSACKRHNLFLRWVVRAGDGVDLGIWTVLSPAKLVVPVDTHMARLGRYLRLTARNAVDGRMAEEITDAFRAVSPEDPVRFDFALTRIGILKDCTVTSRGTCGACPLGPACSGRMRPRLPGPGRGRRRPTPGENDVAPPSPLG